MVQILIKEISLDFQDKKLICFQIYNIVFRIFIKLKRVHQQLCITFNVYTRFNTI